jgi:hypothetical protein
VERLKLIVQNRRFLVLDEKGRSPNLASETMGAALRALSAQWRKNFGYRPRLAESFTDPEASAGTCSKASNWEPVGFSAGYSRHRANFYVANDRPKRLWLRPLDPSARRALSAVSVPADCATGVIAPPNGVLPITLPQMLRWRKSSAGHPIPDRGTPHPDREARGARYRRSPCRLVQRRAHRAHPDAMARPHPRPLGRRGDPPSLAP